MITAKQIIDELYNLYFKEVEVKFEDSGLYDRFYNKRVENIEYAIGLCEGNEKRLRSMLERIKKDDYLDYGRYSLEYRYWEFTEEENYEYIRGKSQNIFHYAVEKVKGRTYTPEEIAGFEETVSKMKECLKNVTPFHKVSAENFVSEAIVELGYLKYGKPVYSLRLGSFARHYKK